MVNVSRNTQIGGAETSPWAYRHSSVDSLFHVDSQSLCTMITKERRGTPLLLLLLYYRPCRLSAFNAFLKRKSHFLIRKTSVDPHILVFIRPLQKSYSFVLDLLFEDGLNKSGLFSLWSGKTDRPLYWCNRILPWWDYFVSSEGRASEQEGFISSSNCSTATHPV
jgi:hypothetical protein